tara:strand:- start:990 stop:1754 length:765 start_codon:yes stop_codon:yes gene_type:complete
MFDSKLDPTVWILGKYNEHIPSISFAPESIQSRIVYCIFYFLLWYLITNRYADTKHHVEIFSGFIFGLGLLFLLDYINNNSEQLVIDKNTGAFTYINSRAFYIALDDKYFKFDKTNSILMKTSKVNKLIKEKKLNAVSYYDYINNQYLKVGTPKLGTPWSSTSNSNIKLMGASYMIISLITLGMISGSISGKLSKSIMPYIILATLFSVGSLSYWIYTINIKGILKIATFKLKSMIIAISFSITACLVFLNETN